ncbi:hypothetical protein, partial [Lactococcus petauri]|uniref:hypothetical protein n=1 Tax=Lactococcus petauri TaxID=1940789 RepID=UPI0021F0B2C4
NMVLKDGKCECPSLIYNNECVSTCPEGYTSDSSNICIKCNKKIYNNICILSCPENTVDIGIQTCVDKIKCINGISQIKDNTQI